MTWTNTKLKYLARAPITNGLGEAAQEGDVEWPRYIRTTDIATPRSLDPQKRVTLPPEMAAAALVERDDLLLCAAGSLGKTYLHTSDERACYAGYLVRFRANRRLADPRFVSYWSQSQPFLDQLAVGAVRSTIDNFSASKYQNMSLSVPSPDEQRRIADFLDDQVARLDGAIALRVRQATLAAERSDIELEHALDRLANQGTLPVRRLSKNIEQGSSPQRENRPADEGEWGVLKLSSVRSGEFRPSENKALPVGTEPVLAYEVHDGDLLVTRANTPALVGDVAVARNIPRRLQLCDLIYRVRLLPGQSPDFVAASLLSSRTRSLVAAIARGTSSSMAKLRGEDVLDLLVPIANAGEQTKIAAMHLQRLEHRSQVGASLGRGVELLEERKQALITAAVTGQLDVTTARAVA